MGNEKGSYFGFGSPKQQVDMHARSKSTFIFLKIIYNNYYNNILFFYLTCLVTPKQIRSMIHFSKPILCVMLICGDWSDWSYFHFISPVMVIAHEVWNFRLSYSSSFPIKMLVCLIKQCLWTHCCFVYSVTGKTAILTPKAAPSGTFFLYIIFSFRPTRKDQQEGGQYANVSCWCSC